MKVSHKSHANSCLAFLDEQRGPCFRLRDSHLRLSYHVGVKCKRREDLHFTTERDSSVLLFDLFVYVMYLSPIELFMVAMRTYSVDCVIVSVAVSFAAWLVWCWAMRKAINPSDSGTIAFVVFL